MATELYFIVQPEMPADRVIEAVRRTLDAGPAAAILLRRGARGAEDYRRLTEAVRPLAQDAGAALLIEGDAAEVRRLGADGLHLDPEPAPVRAAIKALRPDFIVGTGPVADRHTAMELGEAGVDYVLFGSLSGAISETGRDLAHWWAQTMEIPSVLADPGATTASYDAAGCEFIGLTLPGSEPRS
jgi:thiamine-phosphate pyrophosphorylase